MNSTVQLQNTPIITIPHSPILTTREPPSSREESSFFVGKNYESRHDVSTAWPTSYWSRFRASNTSMSPQLMPYIFANLHNPLPYHHYFNPCLPSIYPVLPFSPFRLVNQRICSFSSIPNRLGTTFSEPPRLINPLTLNDVTVTDYGSVPGKCSQSRGSKHSKSTIVDREFTGFVPVNLAGSKLLNRPRNDVPSTALGNFKRLRASDSSSTPSNWKRSISRDFAPSVIKSCDGRSNRDTQFQSWLEREFGNKAIDGRQSLSVTNDSRLFEGEGNSNALNTTLSLAYDGSWIPTNEIRLCSPVSNCEEGVEYATEEVVSSAPEKRIRKNRRYVFRSLQIGNFYASKTADSQKSKLTFLLDLYQMVYTFEVVRPMFDESTNSLYHVIFIASIIVPLNNVTSLEVGQQQLIVDVNETPRLITRLRADQPNVNLFRRLEFGRATVDITDGHLESSRSHTLTLIRKSGPCILKFLTEAAPELEYVVKQSITEESAGSEGNSEKVDEMSETESQRSLSGSQISDGAISEGEVVD